MKLAIIGTGISGLAAAWLARDAHEVVVYDRAARAGGHSNTVMVGAVPVDTGFIVYNERNYPRLSALFAMLGVETAASDMSFSASVDDGRIEYAGDALFAQRSNIVSVEHWRMLADIVRFNREARAALDRGLPEDLALGDWLARFRFGDGLLHRYLLPMAAAIWSCPTATMTSFPATSLLRFFDNHGLLDLSGRPRWRTVVGGSVQYVARLTADLGDRLRLGDGVRAVRRHADGCSVQDSAGKWQRFDGVVFATHADDTLGLLDDADQRERALLGPFRFQRNIAVLHSDTSLMPRRRAAWSSWNYLARGKGGAAESVSVTYWMNRLQPLPGDTQYFVTLNPVKSPDPDKVHCVQRYEHPVFDAAALRAQRSLVGLQGHRGCWYCGAWTGYGFHEDGLRSALEVAISLGADIPAPLESAHRGAEGLRQATHG